MAAQHANDGGDQRDSAPRVYSKTRHLWIRQGASDPARWTGFVGLGGSVSLKSREPVRADGCSALYAVEPRGYVCVDGRATLDPTDPGYAAIRRFVGPIEDAFPYAYGESREAPRYYKVPTRAEQRRREFRLDDHLRWVERFRTHEVGDSELPRLLRGIDPSPASIGPDDDALQRVPVVHEYRDLAKAGSTIAWSASFDSEGRSWLVTPDLALVPKDKVAPYPKSRFRGVALDGPGALPRAAIRGRPATMFARSSDGTMAATGESWTRLAWVSLTRNHLQVMGTSYLEATDGHWIAQRDATVLQAARATPWGEPIDARRLADDVVAPQPLRTASVARPPDGTRRSWIEVSVNGGWLIAYEGTQPVYATLVATGRGKSTQLGGKEYVEPATPAGVFHIESKVLSSIMAVTEITHYEVTFAQPFHGAYALHASYSHDQWGEKVSMGCVNLSPEDAFWLFRWTEPSLPDGWHAMNCDEQAGYATIVVLHG
jgi:hypothetical protein